MAKLKSIKADATKVLGGVWVDYEAGVRLLVARMGNPAFEAFVRSKQRGNVRGFRAKRISDAEAEAITKEAAAAHILVGWENIEGDDGQPIAYSPAKALEFFNDPALADLYQFVLVQAADASAYKLEADEEARGN